MAEPQRDRIVRALSGEPSPLRQEGVHILLDHVLATKLAELVDLDEAHAIVVSALTRENLERIVDRHVLPGWKRYSAHALASEETVGALVPDPARDAIVDIVRNLKRPEARWLEGAVDPVLLRRLFAPVWTSVLVHFARRLPLPGMGGAGPVSAVGRGVGTFAERITKSVQERAEKLVDAGRTVMGGLGAEVEKRLHAAAREFSEGAAGIFREALRERLESEEGQELVAQIGRQIVDHVLVTQIAELHEDATRLPVERVLEVVPHIVGHAAPRAFVRDAVRAELRAFLALEGERRLGEVLEELGILDEFRKLATRKIDEVVRGFVTSPAFAAWLGRLLDA
jgi:hypothetical protein